MTTEHKKLIILGSGPAGYAASIYVHLIYNADKFDNIPIVL